MKRDALTRALGAVLGLGYVALGIAESIHHMDAFSLDWLPFVWFPALCGGGVLVLLGVFKVVSPAWASIGLVTVGALARVSGALDGCGSVSLDRAHRAHGVPHGQRGGIEVVAVELSDAR